MISASYRISFLCFVCFTGSFAHHHRQGIGPYCFATVVLSLIRSLVNTWDSPQNSHFIEDIWGYLRWYSWISWNITSVTRNDDCKAKSVLNGSCQVRELLRVSRLEAQKQYREEFWQLIGTYVYLVGGFKHFDYVPFHIWDVILPIDELHHVSRWLLHHRPDTY